MDQIAYEVKRAHWGMTWVAIRRFRDEALVRSELIGMTPARFDILAIVSTQMHAAMPDPGPRPRMSLGDIVTRLGQSHSTISKCVRAMEALGLVQRLEAPGDARRVIVALTDRGLSALRAARDLLAPKPNFLERRLQHWLRALGFSDVTAARFEWIWQARTLARAFDCWSHAIYDARYDPRKHYVSSRPARSPFDDS